MPKQPKRRQMAVSLSEREMVEARAMAVADSRTLSAWVRIAIREKLARDAKAKEAA